LAFGNARRHAARHGTPKFPARHGLTVADGSLPRSRPGLSVIEQNSVEYPPLIVSEAGVSDYIALLKPRVMSLVVFTALVGLVIAPVHLHPVLAATSILCIAVGGGAA